MMLSGAQLQSLRMDAAALRRMRPEEQHDDIVAYTMALCGKCLQLLKVDELEIEAVGPLVLLERELPGPVP